MQLLPPTVGLEKGSKRECGNQLGERIRVALDRDTKEKGSGTVRCRSERSSSVRPVGHHEKACCFILSG